MKICICLSGEVRTDLSNVKDIVSLFSGHDVSYVVQVWRDREQLVPAMNPARRRLTMPDAVNVMAGPQAMEHGTYDHIFDYLGERFRESSPDPVVRYSEFDFLPADKSHVTIVYPGDVAAKFQFRTHPPRNWRMWYLIHRADRVRQRLESTSDAAFDLVIRMRIDAKLSSNFDKVLEHVTDDLRQGVVYVDGVMPDRVGDQIAIAMPGQMDVYSDYFWKYRHPAFLENKVCDAHLDLHRYCQEAGLVLKALPVLEWTSAINARIGSVSLAPKFSDAFAQAQLATYKGPNIEQISGIHDLMRLWGKIARTDDPAALEHLLAEVAALTLHEDNQFGANFLRAAIKRKLGLQYEALDLYCREIRNIVDNPDASPYKDVLFAEAAKAVAEAGEVALLRFRETNGSGLLFEAGCLLQYGQRFDVAADFFEACLEAEETAELYEKLVYNLARAGQWQRVLKHARASAEKQLTTQTILRQALIACDKAGAQEERHVFADLL